MIYVEFTKELFVFALFTPRFFIRKFINVTELFLRGGLGNSLKRTYVEGWWVHVKRTWTNKGVGVGESKIRNFERTYFLNGLLGI